jgi:hypothetical protein
VRSAYLKDAVRSSKVQYPFRAEPRHRIFPAAFYEAAALVNRPFGMIRCAVAAIVHQP